MHWIIKISILLSLLFNEFGGNNGQTINISLKKHHNTSLESLKEHADNVGNFGAIGNISLSNIENVYYYGPLKIGTPPQDMTVLFCTAFSFLAVPSNEICKNYTSYCSVHKTYSHNLSSTYYNEGGVFNLTWGAGKTNGGISGVIVQDDIQVGGVNVTAEQFGEMMYVSDSVKEVFFDGLFGLAFPSFSFPNITSPLITMFKQGLLDEPAFAFYLTRDGDGKQAELVLGGTDPTHYTGNFTFTPAIHPPLWWINTGGLYMSTLQIAPPVPAIISTGTTLLLGPKYSFDMLNQLIGGTEYEDTGLYTLDCSTVGSLPELSFVISNESFILGPDDYVFPVFASSGTTCLSGFVGERGLEYFVLGDLFMQKYYTLFDMANHQVGFASAKIPSNPTVQTITSTQSPPTPTSTSNANLIRVSKNIFLIAWLMLIV